MGPRVFVAGLVLGLVAGWSGGCSRSVTTQVDVKRAREAFAKRRSDYGEIPPSHWRARHKTPLQQK
jgi:hypothetical protein